MADITGISWTDHTFNPWWGCTKIAPGCDNCYAATFDKRTGGDYWNPKNKPRLTSDANWNKVLKWNREAGKEGKRHRVFCGSMMDWCDNNIDDSIRKDLFLLIKDTPWLDWQLLTKRATLIEKCLPDDWGDGYSNVWVGVTAEDRQHGIARISRLQNIPAKIKFVSAEPLLEDIVCDLKGIDWIIIGGESGPNCRPMKREWVENLIEAADREDVRVWFKQWGGNTRDKGGCLINGIELKQWPVSKK